MGKAAGWGAASPPTLSQFLPAVRRGELRLLVHLRLPPYAAVPAGGLALDLLPVRGHELAVTHVFSLGKLGQEARARKQEVCHILRSSLDYGDGVSCLPHPRPQLVLFN